MTRFLIARRGFAAVLAGSALALAGCGGSGGDSGGNANWRVVNLTDDVPSVDVYAGTTRSFPAVATNAVTTYSQITVNSYTVKVTVADDATSILGETFTFSPSKDKNFTSVITGRNGTALVRNLLDDEDTSGVAEGTARLRVLNMATDSGALDVYVTNADDLTSASAQFSSPTQKQAVGFKDITSGTYRLRVTAAGVKNDVRLDITGLTLGSKEASTLVLTSGAGGAQVNAALIVQGGAVTPLKTTKARLRVVAGANDGATVATTLDGTAFGSAALSPTVGSYRLIDAKSYTVAATIDGTSVTSASRQLAAGGDYTLVISGTAAAPQVQFLTDDNRLPTSGFYRLRMVHADANFGALTLAIDNLTPVGLESVDSGSTSPWVTQALLTTDKSTIEVDTVSPIQQVDSIDQVLTSQGVYTLFVIGGKTDATSGNPLPQIKLSKDR